MGDVIASIALRTPGRRMKRLTAYFDSGSPYTFISEAAANRIGEPWELPEPLRFHGLGGGKFFSRHAIHLTIILKGYPCYHTAYVISEGVIKEDILIGHDFMQNFNIGLDIRRRKIKIDVSSLKRAQLIRSVAAGQ